MPKTLLLLRHGKTHREGYSRDWDRELKHRGHSQAKRVSKELDAARCKPDLIISSSAVRARETAEICAAELGYEGSLDLREELYGIDAPHLIRLCGALDDEADCVLLVGHNPAFEEAASVLAGRSVPLGTGDCAVLSYAVDSWTQIQSSGGPEQFRLIQSD